MEILFIVLLAAVGIYVFLQTYLPFGGKTSKRLREKSANFKHGKFVNQIPTSMNMKLGEVSTFIREQLARDPRRRPSRPLLPERLDISDTMSSSEPRITWFGHSTFLLEMNDSRLLLDPIFSRSPSPFQALGPQRFSRSLPATIDELPTIDMVLISHDHYDHLDYASIRDLAHKTTMFFVPLGLAAHLRRWGVRNEQITELDWWDEREFAGFSFVCTPSRHFSGRTLTDRFATLWCSWVIHTKSAKVFFSGDTGYGPHFKQIGEKYGPFDLTLLECGQYDPLWPDVHMTPEQTAQAHQDVRGKRMIPMHWGAFVLAFHAWAEPVKRVLAAGAKTRAIIITPKIGETVAFQSDDYPTAAWWEQYENLQSVKR
jgi:L-ascorbate metabolism protein UlaG (beta-lactamase superfamily)